MPRGPLPDVTYTRAKQIYRSSPGSRIFPITTHPSIHPPIVASANVPPDRTRRRRVSAHASFRLQLTTPSSLRLFSLSGFTMSLLRLLLSSAVRRPPSSVPSLTSPFASLRPAARMLSTLPRLPLFEAVSRHDPDSTAVIHSLSGRTFKYGQLLGDVRRARDRLSQAAGREDLNGERIAFLVENSYDYVGEQRTTTPLRLLGCLR